MKFKHLQYLVAALVSFSSINNFFCTKYVKPVPALFIHLQHAFRTPNAGLMQYSIFSLHK